MNSDSPRPQGDNHGVSVELTRDILERQGLRWTRQREAVYEALASTKSHPTAEELFQAVTAVEPGMSLATVYNTLEALTAAGLARRLPCQGGAYRYDADVRDHVHLSLADGRLLDLPQDLSGRMLGGVPEGALEELERRLGVSVAGLSIQVIAGDRVRHSAAD